MLTLPLTPQVLHQLGQHAARRPGVQEADQGAVGPRAGLRVDELQPPGGGLGHRGADVRHPVGHVVQPLPPPLDVPGDGPVRSRRLQEFHPGVAGGEESHPHFLGRHLLDALKMQPQPVPVQRDLLLQVADGYADVIDLHHHSTSPFL